MLVFKITLVLNKLVKSLLKEHEYTEMYFLQES